MTRLQSGMGLAAVFAVCIEANAQTRGDASSASASREGVGVGEPFFPDLRLAFMGVPGIGVPDPTIAAGPQSVITGLNTVLSIRVKDGREITSMTLSAFFGPAKGVGTFQHTGDPRLLFDRTSNRFFLVAADRINDKGCAPGACIAKVLLAVSKSENPATLTPGDWWLYGLDRTLDGTTPSTNWGDFDNLTATDDALIITWNRYRFSDDNGVGAKIRVLEKAPLLRGEAPTSWTDFTDIQHPQSGRLVTGRLLPAVHFGDSSRVFLVSTTPCSLVVWALDNPLPLSATGLSGQAMNLSFNCNSPPPDAAQKDGPPVDTYRGTEFSSPPVFRNGRLWVAHSVPYEGTTAVHWAEIDVGGWPAAPRIVQSGVVAEGGVFYFEPSLMVDERGNMAIVMVRSSAGEYPSAYYSGRFAGDAPGTLRQPMVLERGTAPVENVEPSGRNRYGDFASSALDPQDGSIWMYAHCGGDGRPRGFRTAAGNVLFP